MAATDISRGEMEEDMFDTHLCLVCNQTIVGLINYVMHKKNQCQGKKPAINPSMEQTATGPGTSFQSVVSSSNHLQADGLLNQTQNGGGCAMLGERHDKAFSSQLLFPQPPTDTFTQSLQTLTDASFTSTTTVTLPTSATEGGQYSEIESCQTLGAPSTQSERLFPISNHQMNSISSLSHDSICSTANTLSSSLVTESVQSTLSSTHQNNEPLQSLSFNQDANQNSHSALSVEVQSSLSRFINANLSPITGTGVDPNSVIPSATSGHCEDFFQSLELQSKGAKDQKSPTGFGKDVLNHSSKPFDDDDHADIDLPISKILSNLDFSSDEDIVDLPSDDELNCDFDVYSDEDFDIPPNSHTGGKWKPGEGPGGKKIKWRLGAGPIRHGGKWKPGMSHGKYVPSSKGKQIPTSKGKQIPASKGKQAPVSKGKQDQTVMNGKIYECKLCQLTFDNRYLYSNHFGSKLHKDTLKEGEKGKSEEKDQPSNELSANNIVHMCTVCNQKFHRKYELAKHLVTNYHRNRAVSHPESLPMYQKYHSLVLRFSPYQCQICKFYFNRESDFFDHVDTSNHLTNCEQILGQLCCNVCKFTTDNPQTLTYHIKGPGHLLELKKGGPTLCIIKDNINRLKCKYCGKSISSRTRMQRHITYRHPQRKITKPFVRQKGGYHPSCPDCGKVCVSSSALTIHIRRNHTMERPFKCEPCGKAFSVVGALNSHLKSQRHEKKLRKIAAMNVFEKTLEPKLHKERTNTTDELLKVEKNEDRNEEIEPEDINLDNYEVVDEGGYSDDGNDDKELSDTGSDSKDKQTKVKLKRKSKPSRRKQGKIIKCEHCDFVYMKYADLKTHCETTHPNEIHHCDLCLSTFMSKKAYRIHCSGRYHQEQMEKNSETGLEQFKCSVCDMKFLDERWRNFHYEYQHNHLNNEISLKKINKGEDMVTQLYGDHLQLLEDLPKTSSLSCPECGKFLKKHHLVEHLRLHTGEKPYTCRFCEKSFVAKLSLRRHLMIHMGLTENICEICGRHFKKLETYRIHMERHSSEKKGNKCICDVCGMVFTLQRQVEAHMKRHGERKFKCNVAGCTWTFVMKHELKMHMLTHTKEKKFLCDICGFAATTKNRLQRHVRTHSGVRDYHCSYCPYKAGCSTHLRRHMRIHVGSKPFKCPYCPYTCNTHENVRKHIAKTKKHQGLKIYPCKFCNFGTNAGKEFRDHLLLDHPGEINSDKLDSLSVISGLYVRGEDILEPQEGTEIVQVKERPPKIQKNAIFQNVKNRLNSMNPDVQAASDVLSEAASLVNPQPEHPICSIESYWSGGSSSRNHWFNPGNAAGTMTTLTPDPGQLYSHPVSNADSCFLVNVAHSDVNTASTSYHEGSVASVVVVSSDF